MTPEFRVAPLGDGVVGVTLSASDRAAFQRILDRFAVVVERGARRRGRLRWSRTWDRMFPPPYLEFTYRNAFRMAHSADMRRALRDAALRIRQRLGDQAGATLDPESVADWFMVCAHAQSLYVRRRWGPNPLQGTFGRGDLAWLVALQTALASAALDHYVDLHLEVSDFR